MNRVLKSTVRPRALREINGLRDLRVYSVFEDGKSNESDEKSVKRQIASKELYIRRGGEHRWGASSWN